MVRAAAAITDAAAGRPSMAIMPTATTIVTLGNTTKGIPVSITMGTPVNTTVDTPVSTTIHTPQADTPLADIPLADTPLADIPQADTPLAAVSTRGNL
jgi:hypothetical protein